MSIDAGGPTQVAARTQWVLIVDLDHTLLAGNSFHLAVRWLLRASTPIPPRARTTLFVLALGRAAHVVPRLRFKRHVRRLLSSPVIARALPGFVEELRHHVRPDVLAVVDEARDAGVPTVLATAALAEYARPFGRALGFDHVVASEARPGRGGEVLVEARGATKVAATGAVLERHGLAGRRRVLLADHRDDLPLAGACDLCQWVRPGVAVPAAMPWSPGRTRGQTGSATLP